MTSLASKLAALGCLMLVASPVGAKPEVEQSQGTRIDRTKSRCIGKIGVPVYAPASNDADGWTLMSDTRFASQITKQYAKKMAKVAKRQAQIASDDAPNYTASRPYHVGVLCKAYVGNHALAFYGTEENGDVGCHTIFQNLGHPPCKR